MIIIVCDFIKDRTMECILHIEILLQTYHFVSLCILYHVTEKSFDMYFITYNQKISKRCVCVFKLRNLKIL